MDINQMSLEWSLGDPFISLHKILWLDGKYVFYMLYSGIFEDQFLRP